MKDLYKMYLQLFAEDDVILPDDFEAAQPEAQEETTQEVEQPKEAEKVEQPKEVEQPKVKLKYNHEEKEYSLDEVIPLAQKGMNYDKVMEQLNSVKNDERLTKYERIQQLAELYDMDDNALVDALFDQYADHIAEEQKISKEQAKQMIEKKFDLDKREKAISQKEKEYSDKEKSTKEQQEFLDYFQKINGKGFDPNTDTIPDEVWREHLQNGVPLKTAYADYKLNELQTKLKTIEKNQENQKKAPVSGTTTHGSVETASEDPFLMGFNSV